MNKVYEKLSVPEARATMHPSKLFGLERGPDGLVRAVGPGGRRSAHGVVGDVAERLLMVWHPDLEELLAAGKEEDALEEAHGFLRSWDLMAPGETLSWMRSRMSNGACFALPGAARVEPRPDGLVYLVLENGATSRRGVHPMAAVSLLTGWGGLDSAADLVVEYLNDTCDRLALGGALMVRWDAEVASMPADVRDLPVAA